MECPNRYKCLVSGYRWQLNRCLKGQKVKLSYYQPGYKAIKITGRMMFILDKHVQINSAKIKGVVKDSQLSQQLPKSGKRGVWCDNIILRKKWIRYIKGLTVCKDRQAEFNRYKGL